jgi:hypothetical protein
VLNVNINVNIGKLEMFGTKGSMGSSGMREDTGSNNNNKDKMTKLYPHVDKSQLLYNRIRSNSSNDNYSKFALSSASIAEHQDYKGDKIITRDKLLAKDAAVKGTDLRQYNHYDRNDLIASESFGGHSALINEDDNIFGSESFSKKDIMDKINKKLLKIPKNFQI